VTNRIEGGDKIDREVGRRGQHKFNSAMPTKEVNAQHRRWQGLPATSAGLPRAPESPLPKRNCSDRSGGLGWPAQRLAPHFVRPTAHPWLISPLGEGGKRVHAAELVADNQEAHEVKITSTPIQTRTTDIGGQRPAPEVARIGRHKQRPSTCPRIPSPKEELH
jgi:hypothetical protein